MATTDIVSEQEAGAYLGNPADATGWMALIEAISDRVDDLSGPVVQRAVTDVFDGGHSSVILRKPPAATITSVTEVIGTTSTALTLETASVKPSTGYLFDANTSIVYRRASGYDYPFWPNRQNVTVVYSAGRYANTAAVSQRFKQATLLTLAHHWQKERGTGNAWSGLDEDVVLLGDGFAIPRKAWDLLGNERRVRVGIA